VRPPVLATLALLVAAPAAGADPPWSAPRDASPPADFLTTPGIAFGRDGSALLSWNAGTRGGVATLRPDGAIVQHGTPGFTLVAKPLAYGRNRTVLLQRARHITKDFRTLDRLAVIFGTVARPLGHSRRVAVFHAAGEEQGPAIATTQDEVAVAWVELRARPRDPANDRYRIRVAVSRGGRAFGRPTTLATTGLPTRDSQSVALTYGPRRELLAAYSTARRANGRGPVIAVRTRRPGHGFGPARQLGVRSPLTDLVAAAAPNGRTVVAWGSQDAGEESSRPWVVRATLRGAGRRRFARAVVLDPGETRDRHSGDLQAAMARDGTATLAWTNLRGDELPLRTARAAPRRAFGRPVEIAASGIVGGLAVDAGGATILSWTEAFSEFADPVPPADVFAALRRAGAAAFGPSERVSTPELDDRAPAVAAFDPAGHRATIAWPAGSGLQPTRLQISTRVG
jgi:hypothetical protein